jgi:hypothetical protein
MLMSGVLQLLVWACPFMLACFTCTCLCRHAYSMHRH